MISRWSIKGFQLLHQTHPSQQIKTSCMKPGRRPYICIAFLYAQDFSCAGGLNQPVGCHNFFLAASSRIQSDMMQMMPGQW